MNNINLNGRLPEDLPDKMTIDDILLELEDTNEFDINWIDLRNKAWHGNSKTFNQWVEIGQVCIMKCEPYQPFSISEDWSFDTMPMPTMTYKEIRYHIFRYPIRLEVKFKNGILSLSKSGKLIESLKETYLRLKDYLGTDIIHDHFELSRFTLELMISEVKEIKLNIHSVI